MNTRINNALILLKDGKSYQVENLYLRMKNEAILLVFGKTSYSNLNFLTRKKALEELNDIKSSFEEILEISQDFKVFVKMKKIEYILIDSFEKGGYGICSEKNGSVTWLMDLKS